MSNASQDTPARIVVGVDGSASSEEALRWAVRQAELTKSTVEAVTAWDYPQFYGSMGWAFPQGELAEAAGQTLKDALAAVGGTHSPVPIKEMLVVGSRGHGGFTEALLGSVGQHCVGHANCPVVIIRDHAE